MAWLKQLFSRRKIYSDLSEEIRQHLDEKVAEFISGGMSPEEAQHRARRDFGNVTLIEERSREAWQWPTFESCWADIRDEIRQLRKRPALAAIIVLTFGLGIGASTATFSVADAFLFRPLGLPDSEHLVSIHQLQQSNQILASYADFASWQGENRSFTEMAAYTWDSLGLTGNGRGCDSRRSVPKIA
jgi:hypothetical protein